MHVVPGGMAGSSVLWGGGWPPALPVAKDKQQVCAGSSTLTCCLEATATARQQHHVPHSIDTRIVNYCYCYCYMVQDLA